MGGRRGFILGVWLGAGQFKMFRLRNNRCLVARCVGSDSVHLLSSNLLWVVKENGTVSPGATKIQRSVTSKSFRVLGCFVSVMKVVK